MSKTQEIVKRIHEAVSELSKHLTQHPDDLPEAFEQRATLVFHAPDGIPDLHRRMVERDTLYFQRSGFFETRNFLEGEKDADGDIKELVPGWSVMCVLNFESPTDSKELEEAAEVMIDEGMKAAKSTTRLDPG